MHTQLAEPKAPVRHLSAVDSPTALPDLDPALPDLDPALPGERLAPARGIMTAMVISAPFWALTGLALYLLT